MTNNFAPPTEASTAGQANASKAPSLEEELQHLGLGESHYELRKMFDHYIESAVVGKRYVYCRCYAQDGIVAQLLMSFSRTCAGRDALRKPDPEIYKHALDLLKVQATEVIFLDDIGPNLKAAQKLGITTIRKSSCPF